MSAPASLPMYALPGTGPYWAALWAHFAAHLRAAGLPAPGVLHQPADLHRHWRDPRLLLSQTCARPMKLGLHAFVRPVAAFHYDLPGCGAGQYYSTLIARVDGPASGRVAYNGPDSQSGFGVLGPLGIDPTGGVCTGAHVASVRAVQRGVADIAAIDSYTWRLLGRQPGARAGLRVIAVTPPTPGTPLITGPRFDPEDLRAALARAMAEAPRALLRRLALRRALVAVDPDDYRP
ncbi:phosphate/phosphite/phosphonate ABC transporter substrate-binding protein [Oceanibium sediminis]|uniref:phosphate/phosphite/phosphonate ABC transporter substrate-binding protein n=1 Tax=Oceanibium sediminis TaxID=2026339 RepID=UPI000DD32B0F|nr:PhnD/SsuA/transferrin family substrate-binding protein [Oceanibium sediminis]